MAKKSKKYIDEYLDETESCKTGNKQAENNDSNVKEVGVKPERDSNGRFVKGVSGNVNGRPPAGEGIVDQFRNNPKSLDILQRIIDVANTLGTPNQHKDAMSTAKLVVERIIPTLKSSEISLESKDEKGYVFMPEQKPAQKDDD